MRAVAADFASDAQFGSHTNKEGLEELVWGGNMWQYSKN